MRDIKYLSPTSIKLFTKSPEEFYERYLADVKTPREPQYPVMAVGSAFDAYIKHYLSRELLGANGAFDLRGLFEDQVEEQNRDAVWDVGKTLLDKYIKLGAAADLMVMLAKGTNVRFEFSLQGALEKEGIGCTLLGKPDLFFEYNGVQIILDWKVNGYMSKKRPSPCKGYIGALGDFKRRRHKDALTRELHGVTINFVHPLEMAQKDWGRQLAIYGWLLGAPIGGEFIVAIDQLICGNGEMFGIAQHRTTISQDFQLGLWEKACEIWKRCKTGHFYPELSLEDSQSRCRLMDEGPSSMDDFGRER